MKEEVIRAVQDGRIIAIIRGFAPEICLKLAEAYASGGEQSGVAAATGTADARRAAHNASAKE